MAFELVNWNAIVCCKIGKRCSRGMYHLVAGSTQLGEEPVKCWHSGNTGIVLDSATFGLNDTSDSKASRFPKNDS